MVLFAEALAQCFLAQSFQVSAGQDAHVSEPHRRDLADAKELLDGHPIQKGPTCSGETTINPSGFR